MHYYDSQPGTRGAPTERTVLFLHGLGSSSVSLLPLAALMRRHCRVIVPDVMHFGGLSEPTKERFTPQDHIEVLSEFFDALAIESVDLFGHSLGGAGAIHLATRFPDRSRSVTLVNPGGFSFGFERIKADLLDVGGDQAARLYEQIVGTMGVMQASAVKAVGVRVIDGILANHGVRDLFEALSERDFVDDLVRELRCPTLLLWGEDDRFLPRETALHIVSGRSDVQVRFVEGGSHLLAVDSPYRVYVMMRRFLGYGESTSWIERLAWRRDLAPDRTASYGTLSR